MSIEAETAVVTQQKEVAQKDLKTAQSGFLAKIFQPGKYKNEEAARLKKSYNEGVKDTINKFISFIDYMSCSAKTNVTTVGSNGCADQLTNWDGTQKIGLGALPKKKRGMS